MAATDKYEGIVISGRVRLARNVANLPFPHKLHDDRADTLVRKVYEAVEKAPNANRAPDPTDAPHGGDEYALYRVSAMGQLGGEVLREKHLISADLLQNTAHGAAIINGSETISIMVGEEDHVRAQCILPGLCLSRAYAAVAEVDEKISRAVPYAYDSKLGYLTSCPTNVGTGMRASAMMFLPGLGITRNLEKCVGAVARLHMTIRGVYGEGSEAEGYLFQISNQKTLGVSEQEILSSVDGSIRHIAEAELQARDALFAANETMLRDKILRAYGVLTNAYVLTCKEFMELFALVRLGVHYGLLRVNEPRRFERLVTDAQPALVMNLSGKPLRGEDRDAYRAAYVSKELRAVCEKTNR